MNYRSLFRTSRVAVVTAALLGGGLSVAGATSPAGASPAGPAAKHTVSYSVTCSVGIFGSQTLKGSITMTTPNTVAAGAKFKATGVRITLQIPKSLVNAGFAATIRSFKGKLTKYTVTNSDATPKTVNGVGSTGQPIPRTKIVQNQALTLFIPSKTATFSMGPFTAGSKGTDTGTAGATAATVQALNSAGAVVTTINATCQPPTTRKIWSVAVS